METSSSKTTVSSITSRPTVFGAGLGVVIHVLGWLLLPTELTTVLGLAFFTVGAVLFFWAQRWWVDMGHVLAVVGVVLLLDNVATAVFASGPLIPGF